VVKTLQLTAQWHMKANQRNLPNVVSHNNYQHKAAVLYLNLVQLLFWYLDTAVFGARIFARWIDHNFGIRFVAEAELHRARLRIIARWL